jgi:iron complex outermembrane receptor protein
MRIILIWAFSLIMFDSFGQSVLPDDSCHILLEGHVIDIDSREGLPFALIRIDGQQTAGAVADEEGHFSIEGLCAGEITLLVNHVGCHTRRMSLVLSDDTMVLVHMRHDEHELFEIDITEHSSAYSGTQASYSLRGIALSRNATESLAGKLKDMQGVWALETGPTIAKPVIHGLHSNRVLIVQHGVRLESQQWGSEHGPEVDPNLAGEIKVVKGASSVRYGSDALGGVILLDPSPLPYGEKQSGVLTMGFRSNSLGGAVSGHVQGGISRNWAWRLQGSARAGGDSHAPDYSLANTAYREYGSSGSLGYRSSTWRTELFASVYATSLGILSAAHIGNLTDLALAFESEKPLITRDFSYIIDAPRQEVTHSLFKSFSTFDVGTEGHIDVMIAYQDNIRREYDRERGSDDGPSLDFNIGTLLSELVYEHRLNERIKGSVGVSYMNQQNVWSGRFFIPSFRNNGAGVFILEQWNKGNLVIEGGLRYDYRLLSVFRNTGEAIEQTDRKFSHVSGNGGLYYSISSPFTLRINSGTAWRPPAINELYADGLHHGAAAIEVGDESLKKEVAWTNSIGAEWHGTSFRLDAELYSNLIRDFIYLTPTGETSLSIAGAFPVFAYRQADAHLYGVDLQGGWMIYEDLEFEFSGAFLYARNQDADNWLINMPADRFGVGLSYHIHGKNNRVWDLRIGGDHIPTQQRFPEGIDFAPPPPGYTLVNCSVESEVTWGGRNIHLTLKADNLFNAAYRDYMDRFRYYADATGRDISLHIFIPFTKNNNDEK